MPKPPEWSDEESAIVIYFMSRNIFKAEDISSKVIDLRDPRDVPLRSPRGCSSKMISLRRALAQKHGLQDPYNQGPPARYNLDITDHWLNCLVGKENLEKLVGVKDNKIVDEKVLDILKIYHPASDLIELADWKLRI